MMRRVLLFCLFVAACSNDSQQPQYFNNNGNSGYNEAQIREEEALRARIAAEERARVERERQAALRAQHKLAVQRVLNQDQVAGRSGNSAQVSIAMQAIDLYGTPSDFSQAFIQHQRAWDDLAALDAEWKRITSEDNINYAIVGGGVCLLLECEQNPFTSQLDAENRVKAARAEASRRVSSTFQVVKRVAARYGASI
jgi:hypothetical protein